MIVLVTGSRKWNDRARLFNCLDAVYAGVGPFRMLVHGAHHGADLIAESWAKTHEVPYLGVPARWTSYGSAAGPIRNSLMVTGIISGLRPDYVVAFPRDGRGTRDCMQQARAAGILVWDTVNNPDSYPLPVKLTQRI